MRHRLKAWSVALALPAVLLAACGDDSSDSSASNTPGSSAAIQTAVPTAAATSAAATDVDPAGVLKLGSDLRANQTITQLDPAKAVSPATNSHIFIYDTLLHWQVDGTYKPGLATGATVVDPQTIKVDLRPNLKFTDGTVLDATAAKFSIERTAAYQKSNPGALAVELNELDNVSVESPTQFTIHLKTPIAGVYYNFLGRGETMVVSPTAAKAADAADPKVGLNNKPVGAGAFKLESYTPEQSMRLVKNPDYYDAANVKVAAVEWTNLTADIAAQVNAIRSGAVDALDSSSFTTVQQLAGAAGIKTQSVQSDSILLWGQICKNRAPFDNVKVRQAFNYAIDRPALSQAMYGGATEPQWGFWSSKSMYFVPELKDYYKRDVAKAKQLLAEAGYPNGLKIPFFITAGDSQKASEIVQAQVKEAGIDLDLAITNNVLEDFFRTDFNPKREGQIFTLQRAGLDKVTRNLVPGSIGDICNWNDPGLNAAVAKVRAVQDGSQAAKDAWKELQTVALRDAMNIFGIFGVANNAWNEARIGNVQFMSNALALPYLDARQIYIKKK
ncbi:MAG: ABC transporter substrate-binding protein [Acidimicrobiia bacterium]